MQKNPVGFWELASHDVEKSVQFFLDTIEWSTELNDPFGVTLAMLQLKNQE